MTTLAHDVAAARGRFRAWLEWYRNYYPADAPTIEALSKKLERSRSAVSQIFSKPERSPDFETLVAVHRLLRVGYDALLLTDPPPIPPRSTESG